MIENGVTVDCPFQQSSPTLLQLVSGNWSFPTPRAGQQPLHLLDIPPLAPFAKVLLGPESGQLLRHRHIDELVEGYAFRLGDAPRLLQQGRLQTQSYVIPSHT